MKENISTIMAVAGVIGIVAGVLVYSTLTGQVLDAETINMAITGLIGFAAGGVAGSATK